jgi:hypothetical protein
MKIIKYFTILFNLLPIKNVFCLSLFNTLHNKNIFSIKMNNKYIKEIKYLFKVYENKYIINRYNLCLYDTPNNDIDKIIENKNIRLGRSKDQDGKTNIWSVEPKMKIIEENNDLTESNKNILHRPKR